MPKAKITQVTVSGLATNPNPNALPAGSCAVARNVVSRRPGVLTPLPANRVVGSYSYFVDSDTYPPFSQGVKLLWDEAVKSFVAVVKDPFTASSWKPYVDEGTVTGRLAAYEYNQTHGVTAISKWLLSALPGVNPAVDRLLGFLPGMTQSAYSHFRTFISEKWGVIVSAIGHRRWAGLIPPYHSIGIVLPDVNGWFFDGDSVMYRYHFSLESTTPETPYEVVGPVGSPMALLATTTGTTSLYITFANNEKLPVGIPGTKLFLNIYRSSSAAVESWQRIPYDFRLVKKLEVTAADITAGSVQWDDKVNELGRAAGAPLYTNEGQSGEKSNGYCPPCARDVVVYRDTVFYANRASLPALKVSIPGPFVVNTGSLLSDSDRATGIGTREFTINVTNGSASFSIPNPSDRIGVVPGQVVSLSGFWIIATFNPATGIGTFTQPFTGTTGSDLAASTDQYTIKVYYADGSTVTATGAMWGVALGVPTNPIPGLRVLNLQQNYPLPAYGQEVIWLYTFPAYKRIVQFEIFLTNGQNYSPPYTGNYATLTKPLVSLGDTRPNRLFFSRTGQPEAVPLLNYVDIGAGTILKAWPTESALLILCTDGLWRLTGDDAPWQVNQVDPTVQLVHPDCMTTLNNEVYAWVEDGLAQITENGAKTISTDALGHHIRDWHTKVKEWGAPYVWGPTLTGDYFWNELWLNIVLAADTAGPTEFITTVIFNTDSKNFTRQQATPFLSVLYSPDASRLITIKAPEWWNPSLPIIDDNVYVFDITVQTDFNPEWTQFYQPALVWFNPVQTDDKGVLKQWMDVILFVANVEVEPPVIDSRNMVSFIKALFDPRATTTDLTDESTNARDMRQLSRDIHYWVPRRAVLSDQLQIGFGFAVSECCNPPEFEQYGFRFQLQGFSLRYRVASDTIKR